MKKILSVCTFILSISNNLSGMDTNPLAKMEDFLKRQPKTLSQEEVAALFDKQLRLKDTPEFKQMISHLIEHKHFCKQIDDKRRSFLELTAEITKRIDDLRDLLIQLESITTENNLKTPAISELEKERRKVKATIQKLKERQAELEELKKHLEYPTVQNNTLISFGTNLWKCSRVNNAPETAVFPAVAIKFSNGQKVFAQDVIKKWILDDINLSLFGLFDFFRTNFIEEVSLNLFIQGIESNRLHLSLLHAGAAFAALAKDNYLKNYTGVPYMNLIFTSHGEEWVLEQVLPGLGSCKQDFPLGDYNVDEKTLKKGFDVAAMNDYIKKYPEFSDMKFKEDLSLRFSKCFSSSFYLALDFCTKNFFDTNTIGLLDTLIENLKVPQNASTQEAFDKMMAPVLNSKLGFFFETNSNTEVDLTKQRLRYALLTMKLNQMYNFWKSNNYFYRDLFFLSPYYSDKKTYNVVMNVMANALLNIGSLDINAAQCLFNLDKVFVCLTSFGMHGFFWEFAVIPQTPLFIDYSKLTYAPFGKIPTNICKVESCIIFRIVPNERPQEPTVLSFFAPLQECHFIESFSNIRSDDRGLPLINPKKTLFLKKHAAFTNFDSAFEMCINSLKETLAFQQKKLRKGGTADTVLFIAPLLKSQKGLFMTEFVNFLDYENAPHSYAPSALLDDLDTLLQISKQKTIFSRDSFFVSEIKSNLQNSLSFFEYFEKKDDCFKISQEIASNSIILDQCQKENSDLKHQIEAIKRKAEDMKTKNKQQIQSMQQEIQNSIETYVSNLQDIKQSYDQTYETMTDNILLTWSNNVKNFLVPETKPVITAIADMTPTAFSKFFVSNYQELVFMHPQWHGTETKYCYYATLKQPFLIFYLNTKQEKNLALTDRIFLSIKNDGTVACAYPIYLENNFTEEYSKTKDKFKQAMALVDQKIKK